MNGAELEDPEEDLNGAELEDPEEDLNGAELEDPEEDLNGAELEDPRRSFLPHSTDQTASCCCCGWPVKRTLPPANPTPPALEYSGFLIVRLAADLDGSTFATLGDFARAKDLSGLERALQLPDPDTPSDTGEVPSLPLVLPSDVARLVEQAGDVYCPRRELQELEQALRGRGAAQHSLLAYWRLDLRGQPKRLRGMLQQLRQLPEVAHAYAELAADDPSDAADPGLDLSPFQGYLDAAPHGISARWAWQKLPVDAAKVRVVDLEQRWSEAHVNLPPLELLIGDNRALEDGKFGHGDAVCGQLAGRSSSTPATKVEGIASTIIELHRASYFRSAKPAEAASEQAEPSQSTDHDLAGPGSASHVASTIAALLVHPVRPLQRGDILLLEVQRSKLPTEIDEADYVAIRLAVAAGVIVVEPAGNGGHNLDTVRNSEGRQIFARGTAHFRDSGAIMVAAATSGRHHRRIASSNFGSRLDNFAWGKDVFTCGYGDFYGGSNANQHLTAKFSGTSAAAPCVAGAAALVQAIYHAQAGQWLPPLQLRRLLRDPAHGTHQTPASSEHIGVMPDLQRTVRDGLGLSASPYFRRSGCEHAFASSEIFALPGGASAEPFKIGGRLANTPIPGLGVIEAAQTDLYARVSNRGSQTARVKVNLFTNSPTTLLTPGTWRAVGHTKLAVPSGDIAAVSTPVEWHPEAPQAQHHSLLAILDDESDQNCDPNYLGWSDFRHLVASEGAAVRNAHAVDVGQTAAGSTRVGDIAFSFAGLPKNTLAGAKPEQFTFEVLQRLPSGVSLNLRTTTTLRLELQRALGINPMLGDGGPILKSPAVALPPLPQQRLRGVRLGRDAEHVALMKLEGNLDALHTGHGVTIRQLLGGHEIGVISWHIRRPGAAL